MSNEVRQVSTTTSKEGTSITPVARRLATRSDVPQLQATASRHSAIRLRKKCFRPLLTYGSGNDALCVNDLRCIAFLEAFVAWASSSYIDVCECEWMYGLSGTSFSPKGPAGHKELHTLRKSRRTFCGVCPLESRVSRGEQRPTFALRNSTAPPAPRERTRTCPAEPLADREKTRGARSRPSSHAHPRETHDNSPRERPTVGALRNKSWKSKMSRSLLLRQLILG